MTWKIISQATPEDMAARYQADPHAEYPDVRLQMYRAASHDDMTPGQLAEHFTNDPDHRYDARIDPNIMDFITSTYQKTKETKGKDQNAFRGHVQSIYSSMIEMLNRLATDHRNSPHTLGHSHPGMDSDEGRAAQARLEEFRGRGRTEPLTDEEKRFF